MKNIYPLTLFVMLLLAQVNSSIAALNCTNTVSNFPYSEYFASPSATWSNTSIDDLNWTRHSNSTSSGKTGPSSAKKGSYYYYIESSSRDKGYPSKTAILRGPCFNFSGKSSAQITFHYHMYGSSMGSLILKASTNGSSWKTIWSKSGDQGDAWKQAVVSLNSYAGQTVQLRFYGTTGDGYRSDMAVDYIQVTTSGSTTTSLNGGSISPSAKTISSGQSPGTISNGSSASGGSGTLHYQWQKSTNNGSSWINITGASATYYTPQALTQTTWYKRRAARGSSTAYSNISKITVITDSGSGDSGSSGGSSGTADNLGNHTATQNIKLNGNWLSGDGGNEGIYINNNGSVGIKTSNMGNYELAVNGEIKAKEIVVETGWADFVFKPGYQLKTLAQVEQFIKTNGHLPGIPSENEVKENGIGMGQANTLLLQKIEELTLYIIQQQKEIEELKYQLNRK